MSSSSLDADTSSSSSSEAAAPLGTSSPLPSLDKPSSELRWFIQEGFWIGEKGSVIVLLFSNNEHDLASMAERMTPRSSRPAEKASSSFTCWRPDPLRAH